MSANTQTESKPSAIVKMVIPLGLILVIGTGAGWGLGTFIFAPLEPVVSPENANSEQHATKDNHAVEVGLAATTVSLPIVDLDPIVTNIAIPADKWLRLELALILDQPLEPEVVRYIHSDLLAFARTLRLETIDTPTGYLQFRNELLDRARLRAGDDRIKNVMVKAILVE
jgi:flagellar protein FliL